MLLSHLTRLLYQAARAANKARIAGALLKGNPHPMFTYLKNRVLYRLVGPWIRKRL